MAFNPSNINTNFPPPNYPCAPVPFPSHSVNPCPMQQISQQHMFNAGKHVPSVNPSPFNVMPCNNVPSSDRSGFIQSPIQSMWNNTLNLPVANCHNFTGAPPMPSAQHNQNASCFQTPPPPLNNQFLQSYAWNNLLQSNPNQLLAIASNSSSNNNYFTARCTPVSSGFQSQATRLDGNQNSNKSLDWSNHNFSLNQPPPIKEINYSVNNDSNSFTTGRTWNPIQKTNVPDSNIFQNPSALFSMTGNKELLNPPANNATADNFSVTGKIPMNQPLKFNSLLPDFIPMDDSEPNYNKQLKNHSRSFQQKNNLNGNNINKFSKIKMQGIDHSPNSFKLCADNRHNFNLLKTSFGAGKSQSLQPSNQNLIDVCALSGVREKPSYRSFLPSSNSRESISSSSIIEEFTISDSESTDGKKPLQNDAGNKRTFNFQKIDDSSRSIFQHKMVWMTENIQKALQKRNMLFKQAKTTNDPSVWEEYNKLKNEINEEIQKAKLDVKNNKPKRSPVKPKVREDKGKKLPFNCDTCDRGFSSADELGLHMKLHIKCHYKGCNFEAHPKIVNIHQRMQHDTGYADVINKLQNDEEIKKWREERKRRFPTAENILKKKAEQVEKEARGEVIVEKNHGQFKRRKFEATKKDNSLSRHDRYSRKRRARNPFQKAPEIDPVQESGSDEDREHHPTKLPKFEGMKKRLECVINNDVKMEDIDDVAPLEIPIQKGFLNEFSDSTEEIDNNSLAKEDKKELWHKRALEDEDFCSVKLNADEKAINNENLAILSKDKGNKDEKSEKRCRRPPPPPKPKYSLLKMLLSDEIRHERNVIMQCIRHIVKNNFFQTCDVPDTLLH